MQAFAIYRGITEPSFCIAPEGKGTFLKNCSLPLWTPLPFKKLSSDSLREVGKVIRRPLSGQPRRGETRPFTNSPRKSILIKYLESVDPSLRLPLGTFSPTNAKMCLPVGAPRLRTLFHYSLKRCGGKSGGSMEWRGNHEAIAVHVYMPML